MIKEIIIPKNCPSCESELEEVNSQLFCRNGSCPAQNSKKVEAFAKIMRIKGLGPATIDKLNIEHINELYLFDKEYYTSILGNKIGSKLFDEVENSKNTDFATFLSALSIPLIGSTAARKVAQVTNSLFNPIGEENIPLGEKAKSNLLKYIKFNYQELQELEEYFTFEKVKEVVEARGKVCITGKLKDFNNRNDAKKYLEQFGYTVTSTVSKNTDYLIDEESKKSSKREKAELLNIPIVTIKQLIKET